VGDRLTNTQLKLRVTGSAPNLTFEDATGAMRVTLKLKQPSDYTLLEDRIGLINETL
jgi:hypothetical protein